MLYTLQPADRGSILVDNIDPAQEPDLVRKKLGVVPDAKGLYQRLTARENIRYFGQLHGLASEPIDQRTAELAQTLEMEDFLDRRTGGFSQGQRVKVAIARALIHQPRNILLDEPSNGLDVMSTRALRRFILSMRERGCCVVFSSHIFQEVSTLCDRIVIIAHGRIVTEGTPEQLIEQTGKATLEDAFVSLVGSEQGLLP